MNSERLALQVFKTSRTFLIIIALLAGGFSVAYFRLWPYSHLKTIIDYSKQYFDTGELAPWGLYIRAPADSSRERWKTHKPNKIIPGYRAIMGWNADSTQYEVWLSDHLGRQLHAWPISFKAITAGDGTEYTNPHGMELLNDGSILVNFENGGDLIARLDSCGRPLWSRRGFYHHSIELTEDNALWTWRGSNDVTSSLQFLSKLDLDTGETLQEISLHDDILNASIENPTILTTPTELKLKDSNKKRPALNDIFHPNDVEPLSSGLANQFTQFQAGDLLISLKHIHLIAVIDPLTKKFKWWRHGPWRLQHDPDFGADGLIYIYNNNRSRGRSDIISIDPESDEMSSKLSNGKVRFYSGAQGKLTLMPGDSMQIVVPGEGRVIEVNGEDELVLEFNNVLDELKNSHVVNAIWLPADFFNRLPACPL